MNKLILLLALISIRIKYSLSQKYLFYDVNPSEGFNLRRDVYIRIANLVELLNRDESSNTKWTLVLPPWNHLYHWKSSFKQEKLKWSEFFNVTSLNNYIPVIEMNDLISSKGDFKLDVVYYLQNYQSTLSDSEFKWIEKAELALQCDQMNPYYKNGLNEWKGPFWMYKNLSASEMNCVSFQGTISLMKNQFLSNNKLSYIMIDKAEIMLHEHYGQIDYWNARRSMQFSSHLIHKATELRFCLLNNQPYLGVHLRRGDFIHIRQSNIVSTDNIVRQIKHHLNKLNLKQIFLATDTAMQEKKEIENKLINEFKVVYYKPNRSELELYKDGGVAIIDQILCANAQYFIGTYESTFSFRIQEEREILGLSSETTFNRFCFESDKLDCKSTKWRIKY